MGKDSAPIQVGSRRQLFIDERLVQQAQGVSLTMNPPAKAGIVDLSPPPAGMPCVVEHEGVYYMYYRLEEGGFAVALSRDAERWRAPDSGESLVLPEVGGGSVFMDPKPGDGCPFKAIFEVRDAARWGLDPTVTGRAVAAGGTQASSLGGLFLFRSEDGLHWNVVPQMPVPFLCDTQNQVLYDTRLGVYAAYLRGFPEQEGMAHRGQRMVVRTETPDLMDMPWPFTPNPANVPHPQHKYPYVGDEMEIVMAVDEPDGPGTDLYNPCVHLYPYADDAYIAFPAIYRNFDRVAGHGRDLRGRSLTTGKYCNTGLFETHLAVSRDGRRFTRFRRPYVRCGLIRDRQGFDGERDCGLIMMGIGMIRKGDYIYQYYSGTGRIHGGTNVAPDTAFPEPGVFRLTQRLDGFVSLDADLAGGEFVTPPIGFQGNRLALNADCGGLGEIWVEVQGADGAPLPGYAMADAVSIDRNGTSQQVWWRAGPDIGALADRPVRLRFRMRAAKLYAFQFATGA